MELWQIWWVWLVAAAALGILELILPGFMALGFGLGAALVGVLTATGLLGGNLAMMILVFAVGSLAGWIGLRKWAGVRKGQVKVWDHDINDS
jgi:inner membrane protein